MPWYRRLLRRFGLIRQRTAAPPMRVLPRYSFQAPTAASPVPIPMQSVARRPGPLAPRPAPLAVYADVRLQNSGMLLPLGTGVRPVSADGTPAPQPVAQRQFAPQQPIAQPIRRLGPPPTAEPIRRLGPPPTAEPIRRLGPPPTAEPIRRLRPTPTAPRRECTMIIDPADIVSVEPLVADDDELTVVQVLPGFDLDELYPDD